MHFCALSDSCGSWKRSALCNRISHLRTCMTQLECPPGSPCVAHDALTCSVRDSLQVQPQPAMCNIYWRLTAVVTTWQSGSGCLARGKTLWVFKGSSSCHSCKWCYSWASQFGWIQWIIVGSWAIKLNVDSDAFNLRQPNYFILTPNTLENLAAPGWENNPNIYLPQLFIPEFCADACHHSNLHGACWFLCWFITSLH